MHHSENEKLLINLIEKRKIFWEPIIGPIIFLAGVLGVMIPLYIHSDNRAEKLIDAIRQDMKQFHDESKEFRERWAKESIHVHGRLCSLEEKNKISSN